MPKAARQDAAKAKPDTAVKIKRPVGRPPTGPGGRRVSDFPTLTVRIPFKTHFDVHNLSLLKNIPIWQLVDAALLQLLRGVPADERTLLAKLAKRTRPIKPRAMSRKAWQAVRDEDRHAVDRQQQLRDRQQLRADEPVEPSPGMWPAEPALPARAWPAAPVADKTWTGQGKKPWPLS